ncbi:integrin alpha-M-like [Halichoeres trimaculatus]|uniref:integrin alpha-M-like n=1 Tax=Halichoeres trimaculatus TaxID=147232 RepID=UPI003D9E5077
MSWIIPASVLLTVIKAALCFNIDPGAWRTLSSNAAGFGYQVVQRQSDFLVSAPLEQYSHRDRGQIYKCDTDSCIQLPLSLPGFAVNMSLGLTMTSDPITQNTLACGPTIPKDCRSITMYNGVCFQINTNSEVFGSPFPSTAPECQIEADITFLMDGSGSVDAQDFLTMKNFVLEVISNFQNSDTQFAIAQFSRGFQIHSLLKKQDVSAWRRSINDIRQLDGATYTGTAINRVVREIFRGSGARAGVRKVLIVITDGEANGGDNLQTAAASAESQKIVRFAIGVGNAFDKINARQQLDTIASSPAADHVFKADNFKDLDKIRDSLQEKIFSIEGSQTSGETLKKEMSQGGFSAAYAESEIKMGVVGVNTWKGGFESYRTSGQFLYSYEPPMVSDSYLGYSIAVAKTRNGLLTIVGAPRYEHRGAVMVVQRNRPIKMIDLYQWQFQSGEYFGAEVCAMNLDRDAYTDLILISAPMYLDDDSEGRVYVCRLSGLNVDCHLDSPSILRGAAPNKGRFGSSLAVLPDLNGDGFNDLAVGAPLEDDNQGSIYIFHGEGGLRGINTGFSQRIAGSEVRKGLMFFGVSISQSSFDHSGDGLPDLAVGSKGTVILLRSKPIVMVEASVTYNPKQISTQNPDCTTPLRSRAKVCFTMTRHLRVTSAKANINFTFTLDATRKAPHNRAYISDKKQEESRSLTLTLQRPVCENIDFFIKACPEDALNELRNELKFTFEGSPSSSGLSPSLAQQAQTTGFHPLGFEINCGTDGKCVDRLILDFNFTRSSEIRVGIDELLNVTVSMKNTEENSYNTYVTLTYPAGVSYRKFTILQGSIECNSLDSEDGISRGKTECTVDQPIFKSNAEALFIISYGIETNSQLGDEIHVTANATSGNQEHSPGSELYRKKDIAVKYSIFASIDSTLNYNNFSFGKNDLQKPVQQSIVVSNDNRDVNYTVVIKVPMKLGDKNIWVDSSSFMIQDCHRDRDELPQKKDFVTEIKKTKIVGCSVATCGVFKCKTSMGRLDKKKYEISANLSSGWIEQIGLKSAKFLLTSTATLDYDRSHFIFFSTGSTHNPPVRKVEAEVEVYPEPDFTKEIVGGSLGGLALLALLTAGLYKAGFFKSKYQQMKEGGEEAGSPDADADAAAPE